MTDFGYKTIGADTSSIQDATCATAYPCTEVGKGVSITVYLEGWGATEKVKCALYLASDLSGPIANGVTEERTTGGANGWFTFVFPVQPDLEIADYVIVAWADRAVNVKRDADVGFDRWAEVHVYDGFPALAASDRTGKFSIYCTYELAVVPVGGNVQQARLLDIVATKQKVTVPFKNRFPTFTPRLVT